MKRSSLPLAALAAALTVFAGAAVAADTAADQTLQLQEQNQMRARQLGGTEGQTPLKLQLQERQQTQLQTQLRTHAADGTPSADALQIRTRTRTQTQAQLHTRTQTRPIPEVGGARLGVGGASGGGAGHAKGR